MTLQQSTEIFVTQVSSSHGGAVFWYRGLLLPGLMDTLRSAPVVEARQLVNDQALTGNIDLERESSTNWKLLFQKLLERFT